MIYTLLFGARGSGAKCRVICCDTDIRDSDVSSIPDISRPYERDRLNEEQTPNASWLYCGANIRYAVSGVAGGSRREDGGGYLMGLPRIQVN